MTGRSCRAARSAKHSAACIGSTAMRTAACAASPASCAGQPASANHPHRRRGIALARPQEKYPKQFDIDERAASTAACARKPARVMPSSSRPSMRPPACPGRR